MLLSSGQVNRKSWEGKRGDSRSWQVSLLTPNLSPSLSQRACRIPEAEARGADAVRLLCENFSGAWALCWSSASHRGPAFQDIGILQVVLSLRLKAGACVDRVCKGLVLGDKRGNCFLGKAELSFHKQGRYTIMRIAKFTEHLVCARYCFRHFYFQFFFFCYQLWNLFLKVFCSMLYYDYFKFLI